MTYDSTSVADEPNADRSDARPEAMASLSFGEFTALPAARRLLFRARPVEVGSRAFDLLVVLLLARGTIVSKLDIVRYVWPNVLVEESNLRFQMAALRKVLGADRDRIKTVPGRGYLFAVEEEPSRTPPQAPRPDAFPRSRRDGDDRPAIFIVDRDDRNRDALQRLLSPFNARIEAFTSLDDLVASRAG